MDRSVYCSEADLSDKIQSPVHIELDHTPVPCLTGLTGTRAVHVQIAVGCDADILVLDENGYELQYVFTKGKLVRTPEWVQGGAFERGSRIRPRML